MYLKSFVLSYSPVGLCLFFRNSLIFSPAIFSVANDGEFGIANVVNCPMEVSFRT